MSQLTIDATSMIAPSFRNEGIHAWRLVSNDGRWTVTVAPASVTVETTKYAHWDQDFEPRTLAVFECFAEQFSPKVELRLGLRYVDTIVDPPIRQPADWKGYVSDRLLGVLADTAVAKSVGSTQQQFTLNISDEIQAVVRHGSYPDPTRDNCHTYLFDTDVFRESLLRYDLSELPGALQRLHDVSISLFGHFTTEKLRQHLGIS